MSIKQGVKNSIKDVFDKLHAKRPAKSVMRNTQYTLRNKLVTRVFLVLLQGGRTKSIAAICWVLCMSRLLFCNNFFMIYFPKCYQLKYILIVFITYLTKKLWFFYKSKLKNLVPITKKRPKMRLLWWRTSLNKSFANILQKLYPKIFYPLRPP